MDVDISKSKLVKTLKVSKYGMLGEHLSWPSGFTAVKRLAGSSAHGENWLLKNDVELKINELKDKISKLEQGIETLDSAIQEEMYKSLDSDLDSDVDVEKKYIDDLNLDNLNDNEKIEEYQALKTQLEDALEELNNRLKNLENSRINIKFNQKALPYNLFRVVEPWTDFDREKLSVVNENLQEKTKNNNKNKPKQKDKTNSVSRMASEESFQLFTAKLYEPGVAVADDGRRFNFTEGLRDKNSVTTLINEGRRILKHILRYANEVSGNDFESSGVLPLVRVEDVPREHEHYKVTYNAAFITPYMKNGTVLDVVKKLAGKKKEYYFKDSLLLRNLKKIISCMAYLENFGIYHGNIKPNNIYVSNDGFNLLIGDFCPPSELKRWYANLSKNLSNIPTCISPEYYDALIVKKVKSYTWISENLNPFKNDVFCTGLTFCFLCNMKENKLFVRDEKMLTHNLDILAESRDKEFVDLLKKMLIFDPYKRYGWSSLLPLSSYFDFLKKCWWSHS